MTRESTNGKRRVTFAYTGKPGQEVQVTGTFNEWNGRRPLRDVDGTGNYRIRLLLDRGRHEYKFIVDGEWHIDPNCPDWVPNPHGTLNSVLKVD